MTTLSCQVKAGECSSFAIGNRRLQFKSSSERQRTNLHPPSLKRSYARLKEKVSYAISQDPEPLLNFGTQINHLTHNVNQDRRDSGQSINFKTEQSNKDPFSAVISQDVVVDNVNDKGVDNCHLKNEGASKPLGFSWQAVEAEEKWSIGRLVDESIEPLLRRYGESGYGSNF